MADFDLHGRGPGEKTGPQAPATSEQESTSLSQKVWGWMETHHEAVEVGKQAALILGSTVMHRNLSHEIRAQPPATSEQEAPSLSQSVWGWMATHHESVEVGTQAALLLGTAVAHRDLLRHAPVIEEPSKR